MKEEKTTTQINSNIIKTLNKENRKFTDNLIAYMVSKSLLKDNNVLNLKINEILNDIVQAENDSISAVDFFGNNPKNAAKEILDAIPNKKTGDILKEHASECLYLIFISGILSSISFRTIQDIDHAYFSVLSLIITPVSLLLITILFLEFISFTSFINTKNKKTLTLAILGFISCLVALSFLITFERTFDIRIFKFEIPLALANLQMPLMLILIIPGVYHIFKTFLSKK